MTKPEDKVSTATGAASGSGAGVSSAIANLMSGFEKLTKSSDIHSWIEQFEVFCVLNKFEENTKNLVFISLMSQEVYGIVRESLVPEKPTEKPYAELKKLVLQFMSPAPNFLMERYSFRECRQESLSIAQYAVKLRKLSEFCKFEETLDSALRDQLIWGVEDTTIKKRLLAEGGTMKFHDCIKLATTIESATKDASKLQGSAVQVAAISKKFSKVPVKSQKQGTFVPKCWCCGTKGHTKPQCRYKDTTCGTCKRKGHMTAVCRSGKRNSVPVHCVEEREVDEEYHLSNLFCIQEDSAKPLELSLWVNKTKVKFQVDTGSPITAMSLETAKHYEIDGVLHPTNIQFKGYTGGHMKSLGYVEVFFGPINNMYFLVIVDAYSKWLFVKRMPNITTEATICAFREYFSTWGIPRKLCSDNGPSLCSKDMETFLKNNGVQHLLTPPFHPSSNGAAENAVRTCKNFIKKVDWNSKTIDFLLQRFALGHNSTKHIATNQSPAELHIGRTLSTALDRFKNKLSVPENDLIVKSKFKVNDHVMFRNFSHGAKWEAGKIHKVLSPVVYLVDNLSGMFLKRHADQMFSYVPDHGSVISNPWLDIPSYKSSPEKVKTPVNSSQEHASKVPTPTTPVSRNVRLPSPNILSRPRRTVKPRVILDL